MGSCVWINATYNWSTTLICDVVCCHGASWEGEVGKFPGLSPTGSINPYLPLLHLGMGGGAGPADIAMAVLVLLREKKQHRLDYNLHMHSLPKVHCFVAVSRCQKYDEQGFEHPWSRRRGHEAIFSFHMTQAINQGGANLHKIQCCMP